MTTQLVIWVLTLLAGVILTIIAEEPIQLLLARLLGGSTLRLPRGIRGLWKATYSYDQPHGPITVTEIIELRQFGNYVVGRNLTKPWQAYHIRGRLELQTYFTGLWHNITEGDIYHGAVQCIVSPDGLRMKGKWIGFDKNQEINHGPWNWERLSSSTSRQAKNEALRKTRGHTQQTPERAASYFSKEAISPRNNLAPYTGIATAKAGRSVPRITRRLPMSCTCQVPAP